MKILFASNRNPHFANTNTYREAALRALGHEVVFFDVRAVMPSSRLSDLVPFMKQQEVRRMNAALVETCRAQRCGALLVVGGEYILPQTVQTLRAQGVRTLLWTSDAPFPQYFRNIIAAAPSYDKVFCAGTEAVGILKASGRPDAQWLPFACDPQVHGRVALSTADQLRYAREMSFVGSYYPNRARVLSAAAGDFELGVWGPLWSRAEAYPGLKTCTEDRPVGYEEWRKIYAAADIVLVLHYQDGRTPCHQASPKLFEAMACGAFVMCDDQVDARALFNDGETVVFFKDAAELKIKAAHYLARPEERCRIAAAGCRAVREQHTYVQRMRVITDVLCGRKD